MALERIQPQATAPGRSPSSERQGHDAHRTNKDSLPSAQMAQHQAGTLGLGKRISQGSPDAYKEWQQTLQQISDAHSHSLASLESGILLGGGRRSFRAEKVNNPAGTSARLNYRFVETSPWYERLRVALFGSKAETRASIVEMLDKVHSVNAFQEGLALSSAHIDGSGNLVDHNNNKLDDEVLQGAMTHALKQLTTPRLPLMFRSGEAYDALLKHRQKVVASAIVRELYPQHMKKQLALMETSTTLAAQESCPRSGGEVLQKADEIFRGTIANPKKQYGTARILDTDWPRFMHDKNLHWKKDGEDLVIEKKHYLGIKFSEKNKNEILNIYKEWTQDRIKMMSNRDAKLADMITLLLTQPSQNAMIDVASELAGPFNCSHAITESNVNLLTDSSGKVSGAEIDMEMDWSTPGLWMDSGEEIPVGTKATLRALCSVDQEIELQEFDFVYKEPSGNVRIFHI
ncbi:hypothetical protein SCB29_29340 [Paraburkholderia sp. SIMBA_055]